MQAVVIGRLARAFPGDAFIAEESASEPARNRNRFDDVSSRDA